MNIQSLLARTFAVGTLATAMTALVVGTAAYASSETPHATPAPVAAQAGLAYLTRTQNADGSITFFAAPGSLGAVGDTAEAIYAARSLGIDPRTVMTNGKSLLAPLYGISATQYISGKADRMGKLALGIAAADLDPRSFNGLDLGVSMTQHYNASTGAFGSSNWDQAFAMLGWKAAGEGMPVTATRLLASRILTSGGYEFSAGLGADTNSTGLVLQALVAGGQSITSTPVLSALMYLDATQLPDGGWGYDGSSTASDANSTAYVLQGLFAAGQNPISGTWQISNTNPISFLLSQQQPDGGFVYLAPPSNRFATVQAVPALTGKSFPYLSRAVSLRKGLAYIKQQQNADGGFKGFSDSSSAGSTLDAVIAVRAAGTDPQRLVSISGTKPLDYLVTQVPTYPRSSAAAAGKFVVGVVAAGGNPNNFGAYNLVLSMTKQFSATTGRYGSSVWDQSWVLLGLAAAKQPISSAQISQLKAIGVITGGFDFAANATTPSADSTGLALMALKAAGVPMTDSVVISSLAFLQSSQYTDGGWGYGETDVNTTGLALMGLAAYGQTPRGLNWSEASATNPIKLTSALDALLNLQLADGGFSTPYSVAFATYQSVPGAAGLALPYAPFKQNYFPAVRK